MKKSKIDILIKNSTWVMVGKIFTQVFSLIASILVIRKLEIEVFGTYNLLLNIFLVISLVCISQINAVFTRFIPEFIRIKDKIGLRKLLIYGVAISFLVLIVFLSALFIYKDSISIFLKIKEIQNYLLSFIFYVLASFFRSLFTVILNSFLLQKTVSILNMINSAIRPALWIYYLPVININILLMIEASLTSFFVLFALVATIKYFRTHTELNDKSALKNAVSKKRIYKYGMYAMFNELGAGVIGKSSDYLIISAIGNPYYVGLYAFGNRFYRYVYKILPLKEIMTIVKPLFFNKFSEKYNRDEFIQIFNFMIKMMLPIYLIPAVYFIIFGKPIIEYVFDPKYLEAYVVTCIMLMDNIYVGLFYPVNPTVLLFERMDLSFYSKITVIFSLTAGILGMKYFGIVGVAVATLIGNYIKNIFVIYLMRKQADMVFRLGEMKNYAIISVSLIIIFNFVVPYIHNIWMLGVYSLFFIVVTLVSMIVFHPFNSTDLILLKRIGNSSRLTRCFLPMIRLITKIAPRTI